MMNNANLQKALKALQVYDFILHETILYLDGHPKNTKALAFYNDTLKKYNQAVEDYTKAGGRLDAYHSPAEGSWSWVETEWPWKGDES